MIPRTDHAGRYRLVAETGGYSFPQIIIDGRNIGGWDEMSALDRAGELRRLGARLRESVTEHRREDRGQGLVMIGASVDRERHAPESDRTDGDGSDPAALHGASLGSPRHPGTPPSSAHIMRSHRT